MDYRENENLTREAFWNVYRPGCDEHLLHHNIRSSASFIPELSYVAAQDGRLVGNIVYARMFKDGMMSEDVIGFGPISVHPRMQGKGIGSLLITETFKRAKELGYKAVLITGNPNYYSRFGFVSASRFRVHLPGMSMEDEAAFFMAKELEEGFLEKNPGIYDFDSAYTASAEELQEFEKNFPPKQKREPRTDDLG